ncbi:MAG: hypothetical protein RLZZ127_2148, partial [Planctomycetota bacterium]
MAGEPGAGDDRIGAGRGAGLDRGAETGAGGGDPDRRAGIAADIPPHVQIQDLDQGRPSGELDAEVVAHRPGLAECEAVPVAVVVDAV